MLIKSVKEIPGQIHPAVGPKYTITFDDGSSIEEYWEFLHNRYNHFCTKTLDWETPVENWDVQSIVGQRWIEDNE